MSILNKHIVDNTDRDSLSVFFNDLKKLACGRYELYTCSILPSRSAPQRKYFFGVIVKIISDHTGFSKAETNEILKFKFNQKEIQLPSGLYQKYGSSIERETKARCEEIFAEIRQWAAQEMNLDIPEPNQVKNQEWVTLSNEGIC